MAMFNGTHWVSDFVQKGGSILPRYIVIKTYPIHFIVMAIIPHQSRTPRLPKKEKLKLSGRSLLITGEVSSIIRKRSSLMSGESTGQYMIGRSGMWHGGIHITEATTPWCALSGKSPLEALDFPVPFKGEQAVRCMADGEVVAYRVCKDYLTIAWESGPLSFSGSFVLVKHFIQPGRRNPAGCISIPCICTGSLFSL